MSLKEARERRDWTKEQIKTGRDPSILKTLKLTKPGGARSFEILARSWFENNKEKWRERHRDDVINSLEKDVFPYMGAMSVDTIDEVYLLGVLKKNEERGAIETAHRVRQRCERVFKMAKILGYTKETRVHQDQPLGVKPIIKTRRWPALLKVDDLRALIRTIDLAPASPVTRLASRFIALTAQRPGMVHSAEWAEIDFNFGAGREAPRKVTWIIPAAKMKQDVYRRDLAEFDHPVPLSPAAVAVLQAVYELTRSGTFVFPSGRSSNEPMSEDALSFLYKREGFQGRHVPHGWRSSFSTIMNERVERAHPGSDRMIVERLIIDLMLAHIPSGLSATELIYNRAAYLDRRRELACEWADLFMDGQLPATALLEGRRRAPS